MSGGFWVDTWDDATGAHRYWHECGASDLEQARAEARAAALDEARAAVEAIPRHDLVEPGRHLALAAIDVLRETP